MTWLPTWSRPSSLSGKPLLLAAMEILGHLLSQHILPCPGWSSTIAFLASPSFSFVLLWLWFPHLLEVRLPRVPLHGRSVRGFRLQLALSRSSTHRFLPETRGFGATISSRVASTSLKTVAWIQSLDLSLDCPR